MDPMRTNRTQKKPERELLTTIYVSARITLSMINMPEGSSAATHHLFLVRETDQTSRDVNTYLLRRASRDLADCIKTPCYISGRFRMYEKTCTRTGCLGGSTEMLLRARMLQKRNARCLLEADYISEFKKHNEFDLWSDEEPSG
jgi:hypothetical protein